VQNATVVRSSRASERFAARPMALRDAIAAALADPAPRWAGVRVRLEDVRTRTVNGPPAAVFAPIRRIGGEAGWYFVDAQWSARGLADRLLGGPGLVRGRPDPETCREGDVIDCWRVDAVEPDRRLRLAAAMRLPGRAWLSFEVTPKADGMIRAIARRSQAATAAVPPTPAGA